MNFWTILILREIGSHDSGEWSPIICHLQVRGLGKLQWWFIFSPNPKDWKPWGSRSKGRRWMSHSSTENKFALPTPFCSIQALNRSPVLVKANFFTQYNDSHSNLFQKHPHRHTQKYSPGNLTHKINHHLCWEGLGAAGEGDNRGWDGWMTLLTWWTWIWVNSGSWWWTRRPGVLRFMGSQRDGHDWATELNWLMV